MSEQSYRPRASSPCDAFASADLAPPEIQACLDLGEIAPEDVGWLAGEVDNSLLLAVLGASPPATEAPARAAVPAPWSEDVWRLGKIGPDHTAFSDENQRYEARLQEDRERLAAQAAADREAGLPSRLVEQDDRLTALWAAHDRFANVEIGEGASVPAGYYIHDRSAREWTGRAGSTARADAMKTLKGAGQPFRTDGKPSVEEVESALPLLYTPEDPLWSTTRTSARADRITTDAMSPEQKTQAAFLAFLQDAGIGIDCEGYVRQMVFNAMPGAEVERKYNATGWGRKGRRDEHGLASPLDKEGRLAIQAGDILNIDPRTEEEIEDFKANNDGRSPLRYKHIGQVLQVLETDHEVIVRLGHSTPNQSQYNGDTLVGQRPEGVRDDVYTYQKDGEGAGTWRTIRGAYATEAVNGEDGKPPLFGEFRHLEER